MREQESLAEQAEAVGRKLREVIASLSLEIVL